MTTVVINENSEKGRELISMLRAVGKSSEGVVSIEEENIERIPGLPYTREERMTSVRRAEEDLAAGRFVTSDELRARHPRI